MSLTLTVIIRDESPMRGLNEPCTYRAVQIALTQEQEEAIRLRHDDEAISTSFLSGDRERNAK